VGFLTTTGYHCTHTNSSLSKCSYNVLALQLILLVTYRFGLLSPNGCIECFGTGPWCNGCDSPQCINHCYWDDGAAQLQRLLNAAPADHQDNDHIAYDSDGSENDADELIEVLEQW
jgi:hypothetical protein